MIPLISTLLWLLLCCLAPRCGARQIARSESKCVGILKTPAHAALFVGIIAFGVACAVGSMYGIAEPRVHDEHSYLLAGDTYAHGRLTNPPHPEWRHFETFHVIQQPTYISKYPPGQGMLLALGILIWKPILGAWIGVGLACGAFCWLLCARLPRIWAIYGGLSIAFHPGIQGWAQTYLNGCLALCGGCLTLGAALRLIQKFRWQDGTVFSLGCSFLALSRMYEGTVFTVILCIPLLISSVRQKVCLKTAWSVLPILSLLAAFVLYDNFRVTGRTWTLPYVVHEETYGYTPLFLFQQPRSDLTYRHAVMQRFHAGQSFRDYSRHQSAKGFWNSVNAKLAHLVAWIVCLPILWVGLLGLMYVLRHWHTWLCLFGIVGFLPAILVTSWFFAHYAAPVIALILHTLFYGMRYITLIRVRGRNIGRAFVRGMLPLSVLAFCLAPPKVYPGLPARHDVLTQLSQLPGRKLIVVRYKPSHNVHEEWVYNKADIDNAEIVWAREMGRANDASLLKYFQFHQTFLLEPDEIPVRLRPYSVIEVNPSPFFADIIRHIPL